VHLRLHFQHGYFLGREAKVVQHAPVLSLSFFFCSSNRCRTIFNRA
jgi:hypothetical protein